MTAFYNSTNGAFPLTNGDSASHEEGETGFSQSIVKDLTAISSLVQGLDPSSVSDFLDYIDDCKGQILLSGVGKFVVILGP